MTRRGLHARILMRRPEGKWNTETILENIKWISKRLYGVVWLKTGRETTLAVSSVVPSSPILVTLMKEVLSSSETSVPTRATWRNILEVAIHGSPP
jgi:hypothetical protein